MDVIKIYTDGACRGNPGKGGYGIVMLYQQHRKEMSAGYKLTTNNRMELLAVIVALGTIKNKTIPIEVYSDSKYVVDAINLGWLNSWIKRRYAKVKNPDLWKRYVAVSSEIKDIKFIWVKGHTSNVENNRCDQLATAAADGPNLLEDEHFMLDMDSLL